jgi:hypothetical protein
MRSHPVSGSSGRRPVEHTSYSSLSTSLECPKKYQLTRIQKAPQTPAWWFLGGSAVHRATELWDLGEFHSFAELLEEERAKALAVEPDESKWMSGRDRGEFWATTGPEMVVSYISWRERSPWFIWETPDGERAIELDVSGRLPGCDLEIKAYIDRIFRDPMTNSLWIVDLKTGKRAIKNPLQFGTYAALIKVKYGIEVNNGAAFMCREGTIGTTFTNLAKYSPEYTGRQYAHLESVIKGGRYAAQLDSCFLCGVKDSCYAYGGRLADRYDPDSPGYEPPF